MRLTNLSRKECSSLGEMLQQHTEIAPDDAFIIQGQKVISRKTFLRNVAAMKVFFVGKSISPGMVVGIANTDQPRTFAAMFALWSIGAAPLILDYRISDAERKNIVHSAGVSVIFSDFKKLVSQDGCDTLPTNLPLSDDLSALTFSHKADAIVDFKQSSGTTALPKRMPIQSETLFQMMKERCSPESYVIQGNIVSCMNLAFAGTRYLWFRNAFLGRAIISVPLLFTPNQLDMALRHPMAEEATLPPIILKRLLDFLRTLDTPYSEPRYSNLAKLQSIGGALTGQLLLDVQRYLSERVTVTYSFSEAGVISRLYGEDVARYPQSAGRILKGVSVATEDEAGKTQSAQKPGALVVTKEGETHRPGDHGYCSAEGLLYITGRDIDRLCRNSVTFSANDVAVRIRSLYDVNECNVFVAQDPKNGEDCIVAAVECDPALQPQIAKTLRGDLLADIRPSHLRCYQFLPRGSAMKISISTLKRDFYQEPESYHDL